MDEKLFFASIAELNALLTSRQISAQELTREFATRLETLGPRYNALALSLREPALKKAKDVDGELKRKRMRGPLQGIPYGAKDLLSYAGYLTTWGAKPYAKQIFDYTATVIQKLSGAGAVLAAKLSMVELAGGGGYRYASASLTGPGLNPWDPSRWSGGSSSGSAAAVAAGLVPFAIGSETSGSIITPASYCGVTALRPSYGLVSRYGAMPLSWTLDKLGSFARCAEDCGMILHAMAGGDSRDPGSARKSFYYTPQYARPAKELRIGYAPVDFDDRADPSARPAFQSALAALKETGAELVEVNLPAFPYGPALSTILNAEMGSVFEPLIASGAVNELADAAQIAGLKASLEVGAKDYLRAMRLRRVIQQEFRRIFVDVHALVSPGRTGPATPLDRPLIPPPGERPTQGRPPQSPQPNAGFGSLIQAGNLAGLPALVLPCGFAGGLPVALQLVGPAFSENQIIAIGREFQAGTDWHTRRPPA